MSLSLTAQFFQKGPDGGPFLIVMLPRPMRRRTRRDGAWLAETKLVPIRSGLPVLPVKSEETLPILVLAFKDNHQAAVTIPAGEIVDVIGPAEDDRFVVVSVNNEQFHVFASDLADRGKPVKTVTKARAAS